MGRTYDCLDDQLIAWIARQPMFFVATAPTSAEGHVNVSPKGGAGTFRTLGPNRFAYLDLIGSGVETIAHLQENGRIVVMFCAFDGPPKVLRLHGRGHVIHRHDDDFAAMLAEFTPSADVLRILRSIIVVEVSRVGDSCGFVVPRMDFVEERQQLFAWGENKAASFGETWKSDYEQVNNRQSIDALPALPVESDAFAGDAERLSSVGKAL